MSIHNLIVLGQNITLVYESLDLRAFESSKLKGLLDAQAAPMLMDTPEMIVAVFPPEPTVIQVGDQRIRITMQQQSDDVGKVPIWEIAIKCHQLVAGSALVAYGFNYDIGAELTGGNLHETMIDLFVSNPQTMESVLGGHLLYAVPRLKFQRRQTRYDLVLEPASEKRLTAHLNVHFDMAPVALPPSDQLAVSFREEFRYLVSMLPRLLEGSKQ